MIGELTVWLVITFADYNTRKQYTILDQEEQTYEECKADRIPWEEKALVVNRGSWELAVTCSFHHEEGTPAALVEPDDIPPEVKSILEEDVPLPMRPKDSGKKVIKNKRKSTKAKPRP